jgi:VCBS repeat-containing protein
VDKTPAQLQQELGIVQQLFSIFNNYQQNPIDPNQQQDPGQRGDNSGPQNTGSVGSGGGPGSNQPVNYTVTITQIPNGNTPQNPQNPPGTPNPNTNTNTPNPNAAGPDGGPSVPLPTGTFNIINGTPNHDQLVATTGNDHIFGLDDDDTIVVPEIGHGGNDVYDGGPGKDTLKFEGQASVTFELNKGTSTLPGGQVVKLSTADSAGGHVDFVRVEEVVGGSSNDTFVLHDTGNWTIDGGAGNDVVRLDGNVNIRDGATTLELSNIEVIDLNTTNANVLDLDLQTVIGANEDRVLVVTGNSQDAVNFLNTHHANGHWELAAESDRPGFNKYRFVYDNYMGDEGPNPTVYVQQGINTDGAQGGAVQDHIIENVWVNVTDPEGYQLSNETIIPDLLNATVVSFGTAWGTGTVLLHVMGPQGPTNLYYQITGNFDFHEGASLEDLSIKGGTVTSIAIGTLEGGNFTASHAYSSGFNFSAVDFFSALHADDFITLNSFLTSAAYNFWGSPGNDTLVGSEFRDTLRGGGGNDILTGNGGPDTFVYDAGNDTIHDFKIGSDKIDLTAFNYIHSMADIGSRAHQDGAATIITFGEGSSLRLEGVSLNNLSDDDFVFFVPEPLEEKGTSEGHNDSSSLAYKVLGPNGAATSFVSDGWSNAAQNGGHSYLFVAGNVTWTTAQAAALAMNGYLANITSEEENTFIHQEVTYGSFGWIGATDRYAEGNWVWANGLEAGTMFWQGAGAQNGGSAQGDAYNHWWGAEPNDDNGAGDYAYIDHNAYWTDAPNNAAEVGGYIVEFNGQVFRKAGIYGTAVFNATTGELTYALNDDAQATQALAGGQTVEEHFDLAFLASNGETITRTATFTIHGSNDAPKFFVTQGDSSEKTFIEAHANLAASGTLHAFDVDADSHLTVSVTDVDADGIAGLSQEDLLGFFHATAPGADGQITWTFDSGNEAFGGIAPGQSALLHYSVRVSDGLAYDEQIVTVRIDNNHAPEALDIVSYGNDYHGAMDITLSATDDSPSVMFSLQNLSSLLTLGDFSENGFSTVLSEQELQTLTAYSNDGTFSRTIQFRPFVEGEFSFSYTATDNLGREGTGSAFGSSFDGDNEINAGPGNQLINGGEGQDTFVFSQGDGKDVISNMTIGSLTNPQADIILLEDIDPDQVDVIDVNGHIRITLGTNQWIDLTGVSYSDENKAILLDHNLQYPAVI